MSSNSSINDSRASKNSKKLNSLKNPKLQKS